MLGNSPYYRSTIRNYVIAFGSIFDDITIDRRNANGDVLETIKVPLAYGSSQKYLARINQPAGNLGYSVAITLPRMSFEISGFTYAPERKFSKTQKMSRPNSADPNTKNYVYNPVPYDIGFTLTVMAKNADDATQIVEQILPYFTPTFNIPIKEANELSVIRDTGLTLNSVSYEDDYEGDFLSRRALLWTLEFTLNGFFYGVPRDQKIIRTSTATVGDLDSSEVTYAEATVTTNPSDALQTDNYEFLTTFNEDFGE